MESLIIQPNYLLCAISQNDASASWATNPEAMLNIRGWYCTLFPCASFVCLGLFTCKRSQYRKEFVFCWLLYSHFISNVQFSFYWSEWVCGIGREQLLMLNQQIQLQSKNMTSASELYSARKKFTISGHYECLNRLMKNQSILPWRISWKITEQPNWSAIPCQHTSSHLGHFLF